MVHRCDQWLNPDTVSKDDEGQFSSIEMLFDNNPLAGRAKFLFDHHIVNGIFSPFDISTDRNTFAGGQAISLDDHRKRELPGVKNF